MGRDHTLFALVGGKLKFRASGERTFVSVEPTPAEQGD